MPMKAICFFAGGTPTRLLLLSLQLLFASCRELRATI